jgi:uncharacterized protein (DUF2132 family)
MYMKKMFTKLKDSAANVAVAFVLGWMCFALSFQLYFLTGMALNQEEKLTIVADELTVRIDGRYTHDPRSWWYEGPEN